MQRTKTPDRQPETFSECAINDIRLLSLVASPVLTGNPGEAVAIVETIDDDCLGYRRALWSFSDRGEPKEISSKEDGTCRLLEVSLDGTKIARVTLSKGKSTVELVTLAANQSETIFEYEGVIAALRFISDTEIVVIVDHYPLDEALGSGTDAPIRIDWLHYKKDGRHGFLEPLSAVWLIDTAKGAKLLHTFTDHVTCMDAADRKVFIALEKRHCDEPLPGGKVFSFDLASMQLSLLWKSPSVIDDLAVTGRSHRVIAVAAEHIDNKPRVPRLWILDMEGSASVLFQSLDQEVEYGVQGDTRPSGKSHLIRAVDDCDDIVFVATVEGDVALYQGDPYEHRPRRISAHGWSVTDFSKPRNGQVAICLESSTNPVELFSLRIDAGAQNKVQALSNFNGSWVEKTEIRIPEQIEVLGSDGLSLSGFLLRPLGAKPTPLLVRIHGGPHVCYGSGFDFEAQVALSRGTSVLMPNLRGSSGRGSAIRALTVGEWGDMDYDDLSKFVDYAVLDIRIDPSHLYIQGGSYGGYLTNWALTQTQRFTAAISERSISSLLSKYGTSDNGFSTNKLEMGGVDIFDDGISFLLSRSPLFLAQKITTPLLLIHGEKDYRCPIEQSEQLFVALRRLGKEAVLVRFPDESHSLSYFGRPDYRIGRLSLIMSWLEEHL